MDYTEKGRRGWRKGMTAPWAGAGVLRVPDCIRREFLEEAVGKNDFSLQIFCAIIFAAELFNIARVVLWSKSGLATRNNRIYFFMYCTLILMAVLWLVLRRRLRQAPAERRWAAQYGVTSLMFLWHICLNAYDLYRDPAAGTTVLTTALLGLALLIQGPPRHIAAQFGAAYLLFWALMAPRLDTGDRLNLTITFVMAVTVSLAHAHHTALLLKQQKQVAGLNAQLQELVQRDPLTGLRNKAAVEQLAKQMLQRRKTEANPEGMALFLMDLDAFKGINDRYGHPCGDHVLTEMAKAMGRALPDAAVLGRVGGDEFAALYQGPLSEKQAVEQIGRLNQELAAVQWENQPLKVQCSAGVCICARPRCNYQEMYAEADRMLYQAKAGGKGRCCAGELAL